MGLKAILHTLIDHIDEGHGVDKEALHKEVADLSTEIEPGRVGDSAPETPAPEGSSTTAPGGDDVSLLLPGDNPPEPVNPTAGGGGTSSTTPGTEGA